MAGLWLLLGLLFFRELFQGFLLDGVVQALVLAVEGHLLFLVLLLCELIVYVV